MVKRVTGRDTGGGAINDRNEERGEGGPTIVKPLSEDFDGGLGTVFLFHGHVHIVDKDHRFTTGRRAQQCLSFLLQFAFNGGLHHVRTSLCGKIQKDGYDAHTTIFFQWLQTCCCEIRDIIRDRTLGDVSVKTWNRVMVCKA